MREALLYIWGGLAVAWLWALTLWLIYDYRQSREYIEDALRQAYRRGWQGSIDEWQRTYEQGREDGKRARIGHPVTNPSSMSLTGTGAAPVSVVGTYNAPPMPYTPWPEYDETVPPADEHGAEMQ